MRHPAGRQRVIAQSVAVALTVLLGLLSLILPDAKPILLILWVVVVLCLLAALFPGTAFRLETLLGLGGDGDATTTIEGRRSRWADGPLVQLGEVNVPSALGRTSTAMLRVTVYAGPQPLTVRDCGLDAGDGRTPLSFMAFDSNRLPETIAPGQLKDYDFDKWIALEAIRSTMPRGAMTLIAVVNDMHGVVYTSKPRSVARQDLKRVT